MSAVLDAWALVALALGEAPAADSLWQQAESLSVRWIEATAPRVQAAALIKASYRLSYADAFAVAAAQELDATLWTGDPELIALGGVCRVEVLRRGG